MTQTSSYRSRDYERTRRQSMSGFATKAPDPKKALALLVPRTFVLLLLALAAAASAHPTDPSGAPSSSVALDPGLEPLHHSVSARNT